MKEKEKKPMDVTSFKAHDTNHICAIFKVDKMTLYRWVTLGCPRHEAWKGRSRRWVYYREEILDWLEHNKPEMRQKAIEAGQEAERKRRKQRDKYFIDYPPIGTVLPKVPKEEGGEE